MSNPKQILALERFDSYLEPAELLSNAKKLASYLSKQNPPFPVDQIRPTMSYLIETGELMNSNDDNFKIQIAISFVQAYRISSPEQPINQDSEKYIYRLFTLLNSIFSKYGQSEENQDDIVSLLQLTNQIGLYGLAVDCGLDKEIFSTLIKIDMPESVDNLSKLINESNRIPSAILQGMCDSITTNKNVELLLLKMSDLKQKEFTQSIRSNLQGLTGVECIKVFEKVALALKMPPTDLYGYIQIDIENEDDQTREAAVNLLTNAFSDIPFNSQNQEYISSLILRHIDQNPRIRVVAIKFGFEELQKILKLQKDKDKNSKQNEDILKSASKTITKNIWDMAKERIVDSSADVRLAVLKGIYHLDAKDVKLDEELDEKMISRIKDKNPEVRPIALKVMLKLYETKPEKLKWLIEPVVESYSRSDNTALYVFSIIMSNHSLIEIATNITNRKPLLDILKDTHELRMNLKEIGNSADSRNIVAKYIDIKKISKLLKKAPKSFYDQALDYKKRKSLNKVLKGKIGSDAHLLLGLYQPLPLNIDDLLECKELDVVYDLACIYTDILEDEIPRLLKRCNKTDLTILTAFKHYDLEMDDRQKILKALIPVIQTTSKKRDLALKAFAKIYIKNEANNQILNKIKFDKKEFPEKIKFYGQFIDKSAYTKGLYDELNKNLNLIDENTIKYALKIAITENKERSITTLMHFREVYPDTAFKYYLLSAKRCYEFVTPDVFREFAYVMQDTEPEVRTNAIQFLTKAAQLPTTPIQFLALFALSATDPTTQNVTEAKRQLESNIKFRRKIIEKSQQYNIQITPETALPYLVNILAHHKDFEKDLPNLATFSMYLKFFLTPLCATTTQLSYIIELCTRYSFLDDVEEEYTENNIKLFNLAIAIIKELGQDREWDQNPVEIEFEYSKRYYKEPSDEKERFRQTFKNNADFLRSPKKPANILRAGMSNTNQPKFKLQNLDEDSDDQPKTKKRKGSSSKIVKSAPATPKRKTSTKSTKETKTKAAAMSALSTPKRGTKKKTLNRESDDDDEQEESSSKQSSSKQSSSKQTSSRKRRAASATTSPAPSPKRGKAKKAEEKSDETTKVKKSTKPSTPKKKTTTQPNRKKARKTK